MTRGTPGAAPSPRRRFGAILVAAAALVATAIGYLVTSSGPTSRGAPAASRAAVATSHAGSVDAAPAPRPVSAPAPMSIPPDEPAEPAAPPPGREDLEGELRLVTEHVRRAAAPCVEVAKRHGVRAGESVTLRLRVELTAGEATVEAVEVASATTQDQELVRCIVARVAAARWAVVAPSSAQTMDVVVRVLDLGKLD